MLLLLFKLCNVFWWVLFVCLRVYVWVLVCVCNICALFPSHNIIFSILLWFIRYSMLIYSTLIHTISFEYFGVISHKHWTTVPSKQFRESICMCSFVRWSIKQEDKESERIKYAQGAWKFCSNQIPFSFVAMLFGK